MLEQTSGPNVTDEVIDSLQKQLNTEKDRRLEERFIWLVSVIVVFDCFAFQSMNTWAGPFMIGFIEIIMVIALGRMWGMDHIYTLTEKLIDKWDGGIKN